jgi:Ni,Fe-hydrogenase III large subunit
MHLRPIMLGTALVVLASPPGLALAQGRRHGMGMQGGMSHDSGARQQLEPVLQQISELMQQMAERIKAGPLTLDQTLQLSTMLEQVATMMGKLGSVALGADTATQLDGMRVRLTEMQKALVALMNVPAKP